MAMDARRERSGRWEREGPRGLYSTAGGSCMRFWHSDNTSRVGCSNSHGLCPPRLLLSIQRFTVCAKGKRFGRSNSLLFVLSISLKKANAVLSLPKKRVLSNGPKNEETHTYHQSFCDTPLSRILR